MKFNEKLQKLRKEKGMSQEALADVLGVSRQAISKWESGQSYPETEKMIAISELFGVTLDSLIKDADLQEDKQNTASEPFWLHRGSFYQYKSEKTLFGLPLVHINIGRGARKAKGIIAIGNIATGFLSIGFISFGLLSVGIIGCGLIGIGVLAAAALLAVGTFSLGFFSIGAVAVGIITIGAVSIGMFSIGACSIASHIAIGHYAQGHIAIGKTVKGVKTFIDTTSGQSVNFNMIKASEVRQVINSEFPKLWNWITDFMTSFLGR